ncbi:DUF7133 domain-containing protein [Runella salmonicolor]|uniref:DUF7133 domain-containing protein n=1 Tax=Runella salmonicolor TaxID=2950278 RepID=A0ABT1FU40_9BACT|nr:hypothetical protein [Runella salmonicolor]MCP1385264.1 hypothetical protein [Runella salmonicolor]
MKKHSSFSQLVSFFFVAYLLFGSFNDCFAQRDTITNYYETEQIKLPKGLRAETGGMDFMPDGRLVACFHLGEVMTYNPKTKTWKKFAEGLHDPLGVVAVSNSEILVVQRPEMTRIKDTNADGVADVYETITDDFGMSGNYHEFAFGPLKDQEGNLFMALNVASNGAGIRPEIRGQYDSLSREGRMYSCVPYRGWVMRYNVKTKKLEPYASGFRSPNGLGFDAKGRLFVSDNQGDWRGTSPLYHVEKGKFYGHVASLIWQEGFPRVKPLSLPVAQLDSMRTRESIAFPHTEIAHSPTQPLLDNTGGKFGPFAGQLFIGEMDYPRLVRLLMEEVNGQLQGACVAFGDGTGLLKGNNRLVFDKNGDLWVGHNDHGWVGDEGLSRIHWKGKVPLDIMAMNLTTEGFELTFSLPVDPKIASNPELYKFQRYYYKYHQPYGSPKTDVADVAIKEVKVSPDGRKVTFKLAELKAGYVYDLKMGELQTPDGKLLMNRAVFYTLNQLKK